MIQDDFFLLHTLDQTTKLNFDALSIMHKMMFNTPLTQINSNRPHLDDDQMLGNHDFNIFWDEIIGIEA